MTTQITHDVWQGDFDSLPMQSRLAIIMGGISHKGYNEVAAKVAAWKRTDEGANATDEQVHAKTGEFRAAFVKALEDGTLGTGHGGGPRKDPLQSAIDDIVEREVRAILKSIGVTPLPKKRSDVIVFADAKTREYGNMLDAYLDGHDAKGRFGEAGLPNKPRIVREAERVVAANAKKEAGAAKVKGPAASGDLGF
jgi:hypothetical protein